MFVDFVGHTYIDEFISPRTYIKDLNCLKHVMTQTMSPQTSESLAIFHPYNGGMPMVN